MSLSQSSFTGSHELSTGIALYPSVSGLGSTPDFSSGRPGYTLKGVDSKLRPVKDKVRAAVKSKRLRLEEFFKPFDSLNTKKVSEASFLRGIGASGIRLTQQELQMLLDRYRVPGGGGAIDYQRFCDQCNKVFTSKGLERVPRKAISRSIQDPKVQLLGASNPSLTPLERARVEDMVAEMRLNTRDASLVVQSLFNQFDRHGSGCVSGEQFLRVVSCHGLLGAKKILHMEKYGHVLVKAFTTHADGPGLEAALVNYKALDDQERPEHPDFFSAAALHRTERRPAFLQQLMADQVPAGEVVEPKPALLIDGSPEEYDVPPEGESEGAILERLLVEEAVSRRIEVVDYLYPSAGGDCAGNKHVGAGYVGVCSREKFKQILRGLWRTHFTDRQAEALADRFKSLVDKQSEPRSVDLASFARHISRRVSEAGHLAAISRESRTRPGGGGAVVFARLSETEKRDVDDVIADIRGRIERERINLKPAFKHFDPRNELVVAREQFLRVLSAQGLLPTDSRLWPLLVRRYGVSDFRRQTTVHQGFVAYLEFLRDVDAPLEPETQAYIDNFVMGKDQQNKAPIEQDAPGPRVTGSGTVDDVLKSAASKTPEALMGRRNVGSGCSRTCDALIADIRRRTARERVRMMDLFEDFDRLGHGTCTQAQLSRVMRTLDHTLTDGELAALCERYQSKVTRVCSPGDGTPLVLYKNLVSDIEAVFTVENLQRKSPTMSVCESVREAKGSDAQLRGESSRIEQLTPEEDRKLAKFLRELAMEVNKGRLCLPSLFTDFDRFNVGEVTEAGMERALGGARLLPPRDVFQALVRKFRDHSRSSSGGEVNYRAFLAAVELAQDPLQTPRDVPNATKFRAVRADGAPDVGVSETIPPPQSEKMTTPQSREASLRSALTSVGTQLSRSHCQLGDLLAQEDHLRTGEVTTTALKHCLMVAGVHLKASELTAVDRAFRSISRPEMIAWKDFCKAAVDDMERSSPSATERVVGHGKRPNFHMDDDLGSPSHRREKEEELLMKIEGEIKARDPNLEALFKVYDKSNRGTVTEAQFFSLLNQGLPRIHLTATDTEMLTDMFVDRTGCDFGGQVRYKAFMETVGA